MDDPKEKARQHQPNRHLWMDAGSAETNDIEIDHFFTHPGEMENAFGLRT